MNPVLQELYTNMLKPLGFRCENYWIVSNEEGVISYPQAIKLSLKENSIAFKGFRVLQQLQTKVRCGYQLRTHHPNEITTAYNFLVFKRLAIINWFLRSLPTFLKDPPRSAQMFIINIFPIFSLHHMSLNSFPLQKIRKHSQHFSR